MEVKRCVKCKKVKPLGEFYLCRGMRDGRQNKCIECAKRDSREGTVFVERQCIYCGADISKLNWKRTTCNSPECRERWEDELKGRKDRYTAAWWKERRDTAAAVTRWRREGSDGKAKRKGTRLCEVCGDPILNGNWLFCETCFSMINEQTDVRLDGEYLFC